MLSVDDEGEARKQESRTGSAHDDGGPAGSDDARSGHSRSSSARDSRPRERELEVEKRHRW